MTGVAPSPDRAGWASAWPDALAFAAGLALAWGNGWQTTDLVWSLWLASLVVGYAIIVWRLLGPALLAVRGAWIDRELVAAAPLGSSVAGVAVLLIGGLFLLAFFTVHFGGFHYVHSVFLNSFFPLTPGPAKGFPGLALYGEVFRRYGWFLPAAVIAERHSFRVRPLPDAPPADSVKAADIAARKARAALGDQDMLGPYKNVVRMHLLIFFFAFAHFAKLEDFRIYAVVYAAYFFPWRLRKRAAPAASPA